MFSTLTESIPHGSLLFEDRIEPGATWSHILKRGTLLRITDILGGANVGAIFYNAEFLVERLNIPDSLKAQHIAKLSKGNVLYSDMGRILCSITEDSFGWHDPLSGCANAGDVLAKFGESTYQQCHNDYYKNAFDSFRIEIAKYGLGVRDMIPNVNFFSKVTVDDLGAMAFAEHRSKIGDYIDLRFEMNVLTVLSTCPHPLDPNTNYLPKPVHVAVMKAQPLSFDDICRTSCPENERGFILTERYFL